MIAPVEPSPAVVAAARHIATPALLYDVAAVAGTVAELRADLECLGDPEVLFALKANRFPPLLRHLADLGLGADVASPAEWAAARAAGMAPISATGPALTGADLAAMHAEGARVDLDSLAQLSAFAAWVDRPADIGLRIRVPCAPADREEGRHWSRLGLDPADRELHDVLRDTGLRVTRLHAHSGEIGSPERAAGLASVLRACRGVFPETTELNLGGGLAALYADREAARRAWKEVAGQLGGSPFRLLVEPGMLVTALSGYLVATVRSVTDHPDGYRSATMDASAWNLFTWGAPRVVARIPERREAARPHLIGGVSCYENDVFARRVELAPLREGDVLVLNAAGAYVTSMARDLHGLPTPREVCVDADGVVPHDA